MQKEIELYVYDLHFNKLGVIDIYEQIQCITQYYDHSALIIDVEGNEKIAGLLLVDEDRIIVKSNDIHRGYYVELAEYTDETKTSIHVEARSLSVMTNWRIVDGQMRFKGNIEYVMQQFVKYNCITPSNPNRIIPNLVLGVDTGITINADETFVNYPLDQALWEICKKYEVSFEILLNHELKKYVFSVFRGEDRSAEQTILPQVIFAKSFDNVDKQSYTDEKADFKNTAIIEGAEKTLTVNNSNSGFNRRELFVDGTSLSKTYTDENGNEITLTDEEYTNVLTYTAFTNLSEYPRVRSFESKINVDSQNVYGVDFFIGDKITNRNDELGIVTHSRVVKATEIWNKSGYSLELEFGTAIPNFLQKIKRGAKR